jgi:glycine/D-amino acid oxidase-like deaminating enzyme
MAHLADERAKALPVVNPTLSYWQAHSQDSPIHDHGKSDPLPHQDSIADVCIIGSGISGAIAAYSLQQQDLNLSIVMLEARQACSGATGRNGGHCRPDSFLGFDEYTSLVGKDQAHKVLLNEWATFNRTRDIVRKEKIDCDWWDGLTMTTYLEEAEMKRAKKSYDNYRQHTTLRPDVRFTDDPSEASRVGTISRLHS